MALHLCNGLLSTSSSSPWRRPLHAPCHGYYILSPGWKRQHMRARETRVRGLGLCHLPFFCETSGTNQLVWHSLSQRRNGILCVSDTYIKPRIARDVSAKACGDSGRMCSSEIVKLSGARRKSATGVAKKSRVSQGSTARRKEDERIPEGGEEDGDEVEEYDWPPLVCCFGEAMKEFIPTLRVSARQMDPDVYSSWKGLQWKPPEFVRSPGGPASNVAIALVRLGGRAAFMGKVGDDAFGQELVYTMNINGVQTRGVRFDAKSNTGVAHMRLSFENERVQMSCVQPSAEDSFLYSEINADILKEAHMLHFNSLALTVEPVRSSLFVAIELLKEYGGVAFFDLNLPLPLWKSRDETWTVIDEVWKNSNVIEVTKQELEFLLGEEEYERRRRKKPQYFINSEEDLKGRRDEYHYSPDELAGVWHDNLKVLFVTDGTLKVHYYTPNFHGSVRGGEDVLVAPFTCDRTGSGDALVAGIIRKLTAQPDLYDHQENLEKALRFAICAGVIAQWTIGGIRGFPTESAAQNLTEQVYPPSMIQA